MAETTAAPTTKGSFRLRGRHLAAHRHAEAAREAVREQQQDRATKSLAVACPVCGAATGALCKPDDATAYCYSRFLAATR